MRSVIAAVTLLASAGANATTVSIDFEDLPLGGTPIQGGYVEVITEGYSFVSETGVNDFFGSQAIVGFSTGIDFDTGEIIISREDGEAFALYAADFSGVEFFMAQSEDGNFDDLSGPGLNELGTGAWLNITSVIFFGASPPGATISIDNVVVGSVVPVPAAVWLFGSGLGLLGWMRRRQGVGCNDNS